MGNNRGHLGKIVIPPGKDRWRSQLPLVLVYHGPLQIATILGVAVASHRSELTTKCSEVSQA